VKLLSVGDGRFVGFIPDRSSLADRIRMACKPRFVVHPDGQTPTICGFADATILAEWDVGCPPPSSLPFTIQNAALALSQRTLFRPLRVAIVEVRLRDVQVDEAEGPMAQGAVPRT
jgi:hypothetical protein